MIALFIALLLTASPAERLAQIRRDFPTRGKAASVAALESLAHDASTDEAGGRALLWLGDLALQEDDLSRALDRYQRAERFTGDLHRLALRGEGDVAFRQKRYLDARRLYSSALPGASTILTAELIQKVALSTRFHRRTLTAWAALALLALALLWFAWRIRPADLRIPLEALYVAPVYALLILGCLGRDPAVLHALELGAVGSLLLIAASGLASRRAPARPWLHAAILVAANIALFYVVVFYAGIMDTLLVTWQMAAPS